MATLQPSPEIADAMAKTQAMMTDFWEAQMKAIPGAAEWLAPWRQWNAAMTVGDPAAMLTLAQDYWADSLKLWSSLLGGDPAALPAAAARKDKRFAAEAWNAPAYDALRRAYLLTAHYMTEAAGRAALPDADKKRLQFQVKQFIDAMSPANFAATNPEVIAAAQESGGKSLVSGLEHLLHDLKRGQMSLTDESAFEVGRNVAVTPGKVVFENRLFQLIQYAPTTEEVFAEPLVIFPPWINKFYILDLTPEKSFIRWAVAQGLTVFVVSWKNADETLADVTLDSYATEGFETAIDTARAITGADGVHAIGYCVAGTTLAAVLAWLAARGEAGKVKSATYFTAQVDFADAGELLNFIDDQQLAAIDAMTTGKPALDGRVLAATFNMLRPADLIWNYVVNNYLMGKDYQPFDLLFWNSDATSVPAKWHREYLRDCYRDNKLAKPGGISIAGVPIDLKRVETPAYIQAGRDDHIAPLPSVWKLGSAFSGPIRFALAGSGHIAGVVNPPDAKKYQHWVLPEDVPMPATLDEFQRLAVETKGSWWPDWIRWIERQSSGKVPARQPGSEAFPPIEDAPGRYVKERIA